MSPRAPDAAGPAAAAADTADRHGLLRVLTCGSAGDGKSTLIGRLLHDAPTAEHEEFSPADVAHRSFATPRRRFIIADIPGHEPYLRNLAAGASTADLAVILVDARKGVLTETRRHAYIVSLLGIRHIVLAVNKMDLVGFDRTVFQRINKDLRAFAGLLGVTGAACIPVSALGGDNVTERSAAMAWYDGPAFLPYLEQVEVAEPARAGGLRLPVQSVSHAGPDARFYAGTVARGSVRPGDPVVALPSGRGSTVARIMLGRRDLDAAVAGQAVMLTLAGGIDVDRGDLLCAPTDRAETTDQIAAHLIWMDDVPLLPGRLYHIQAGPGQALAQVSELKHRVNVDSLEHQAAKTLGRNEIGFGNLSFDRPLPLDPYRTCRETGSFILIDRLTNATVAMGIVAFSLRRAANIVWQAFEVDKRRRGAIKGQNPCVLWFTGLSGAGKSTIANRLERHLVDMGRHTYVLDGDNVRHGLNRDLGFTDADRVENIRRIAETAKLMVDAGLLVLVSFISPFRSERRMARELMDEGEFLEIYVNTPLDVCERRDPKGLYAKARAGQIRNFTGIDSAYEPPETPEFVIDGAGGEPDAAVEVLLQALRDRGILLS